MSSGARLPSLDDLAAEFGVSVHEARKAIDRLKQIGLVTSWQGKGSFVAEDGFTYNLARRTRFQENLSREGKQSEISFVGQRRQSAPTEIARAFGCKMGTRVQRAELIRVVQGRPAMLARHYYPISSRFSGILDLISATGSITGSLQACGVEDFTRRETSITTRLPNAHEALMLQISRRQPVLITIGINVDPDGAVVEVSEAISRGDRVRLRT